VPILEGGATSTIAGAQYTMVSFKNLHIFWFCTALYV
jgi:hypothetical protein